MFSLLCMTMLVFANNEKPFTEGRCERAYGDTLYCEDDKNNICIIYEYEDGEIRFGCKKQNEETN